MKKKNPGGRPKGTYGSPNSGRPRGSGKIYSYKGKTNTVRGFAEKYHIEESTLFSRLRLGWGIVRSIETPVKRHRRRDEE